MPDDDSDPKPAEAESEQAESDESERPEGAAEGADEPATEDGDGEQPEIEADEQATIPDNIDAEAIEDDTAEETSESDESGDAGAGDGDDSDGEELEKMEPETAGSPVQAGELYVTLVHQTTNAAIRAKGSEDSEEVNRDHFEQYDLAHYFDLTMEEMGVGSDLEPHEALVVATAMSVGQPILEETDVMDDQIGKLMDTATGAA